jgi:hypothetical protein
VKPEGPLGWGREAAAQPFAPPMSPVDDVAPLLPLTLPEHVELVLASNALRAFAAARAAQILDHGHSADQDLLNDVSYLVRQAKGRLVAYLDYVPPGMMNAPPGRIDQLLKYIDKAGALLLAARERLLATPEQLAAAALAKGPTFE